MEKFRVSKDMLLENGVLRPEEIIDVGGIDPLLLRRVHEPDYVNRVESGTLDRREQIILGLPASPELFKRSATEVEATRLTCHAALTEGVAACLAGGNHRAFREHGEGFSVFNDVAVAIRDLQARQPTSGSWWWTPTPAPATAPTPCWPEIRGFSPTRSTFRAALRKPETRPR